MVKSLNEWFHEGLTNKEYVDSMTVNKKELQSIYDRFTLPEKDKDFYQTLPKKQLKAVVLTADWCGDAMLCVPIIERIAEYAGIELKYLIRDENLELMDQYLTNGTSRAIPKFIFMDQDGNEKAVWGPRSPEVQSLIEQERGKLPSKNDPAFEQKQQEMYRLFKEKLTSDEDLWQSVNHSLKNELQKLTV